MFVLLCLALVPPLILLSYYTKRKLSRIRGNIKTSSEKALQHLKEALSGYIESNLYHTNTFFTQRYSLKQQTLNRYLASLQAVQVLPTRLMEIFAILGLLGLMAYDDWVGDANSESIFTIGAFLGAAIYRFIAAEE